MDTIIPYALLCFTSFFTLTNPLGTMPVFLTMTNGLGEQERRHIVKRATIISFIILIAFTFCGQFLFKFFGISTLNKVRTSNQVQDSMKVMRGTTHTTFLTISRDLPN